MIQKIILGSILLDHGVHDLVFPLLKPEYFEHKNRYLFELMAGMYHRSEPIDNVTVYLKIGKSGKWKASELVALTNGIASTANVLSYIQELKTNYVRDQFVKLTGIEISKMDDPGIYISEMIGKLTKLQEDQVIGVEENIVDIVDKALNEILTEKNTTGMIGLPTPSGKINNETRGFRKAELIILAGRPGMGKTAFALSIVRVCCEYGAKIAYFSLEMKSTELVKRFIRSYSDYEAGAGKISNWKIHLFDRGGIDIDYIRSNVRLLRDCDMIVVDYLGLMKVNNKIKRAEAIGEVSRALKAFAKEIDIPILLLCQLNRDSEGRQSTVHRLADLRESGDIEQDADKVFFITRPGMIGDEKTKNPNDLRIIIQKEKDRNGRAPIIYNLKTDENFTNFYDESEPDWPKDSKVYYAGSQPDAF